MYVRQRRSTNELVLSFAAFKAADYGQVCERLGLRPSQPDRNAAGHRARRRRSRGAVIAR